MLLLPPAPTTESLRAKLGKSYAWVVLMVISAGGIATVLATTGFAVAIPSVMQQFHVGNDVAQLSMSAYMAAMTIALLPAAWMYERFGLRRCFLVAVGAMLVSSIVGAYSTSFSFMVAMRIAQGVTAGVTGPMGIVAVMRLFPPERQGRAWGVIGFATVLAPAIAPALGGAFVDAYGWQSIFWINVPFCIVALISAFFLLPYVPPRTERGPDWIGLLLLAIASVAIIALATFLHSAGPLSWQVLTCAVTGTLATGTFLLHAKRIDNPIVSPRILQNPRVAAGAAISLTYGMGLYGSTYLIPLFMQSALGFSAADSGMALLPAGITLAFMILIGGWWVDHGSPRLIATLGTALFGASFFVMWMFAPHLGYWGVATAAVVSRIDK